VTLVIVIGLVMACSGALMAGLVALYPRGAAARYRIREEKTRKLAGVEYQARIIAGGIVSAGSVWIFALLCAPFVFHERPTSLHESVLRGLGVLLFYDFTYYLTHRFAFHQWGPLRRVHALHHTARHPRALDSLYVHPIETLIGVALLFASIAVMGPLHVHAFGAVLFVYSVLNIAIHGGLDAPWFPLSLVGAMAVKHDRHHVSMRSGNFASITPLFDRLLGTRE
jgi:sterol desaturase/sphingolipid hydroxylase (fatty acid hydroxylase superfamily)